jgi:hypothetical protein
MKNLIFGCLLVLIATSCGKWNDDKDKNKRLTYYTEDFKEADLEILGVPTSEIDALWAEFKAEDKIYNSYSLIVKSDGKMIKEYGTCSIDWNEQIKFMPNGGKAYIGKWISEKEKYVISFEGKTRTEELTFIYKDTGMCGK